MDQTLNAIAVENIISHTTLSSAANNKLQWHYIKNIRIHFTFWILRSIESAEQRARTKRTQKRKKNNVKTERRRRENDTERKNRVKQAIKIKSMKIGETS